MLFTLDVFADLVRTYMRDFPELNRLISGVESSTRMIKLCIVLALDAYNGTPPILSAHTVQSFPDKDLLMLMTIFRLLRSVVFLKARNRLPYQHGGFSADTETQADSYLVLMNMLQNEIAPRMQAMKVSTNISSILGQSGVHSEYALLHGWFDYQV